MVLCRIFLRNLTALSPGSSKMHSCPFLPVPTQIFPTNGQQSILYFPYPLCSSHTGVPCVLLTVHDSSLYMPVPWPRCFLSPFPPHFTGQHLYASWSPLSQNSPSCHCCLARILYASLYEDKFPFTTVLNSVKTLLFLLF